MRRDAVHGSGDTGGSSDPTPGPDNVLTKKKKNRRHTEPRTDRPLAAAGCCSIQSNPGAQGDQSLHRHNVTSDRMTCCGRAYSSDRFPVKSCVIGFLELRIAWSLHIFRTCRSTSCRHQGDKHAHTGTQKGELQPTCSDIRSTTVARTQEC